MPGFPDDADHGNETGSVEHHEQDSIAEGKVKWSIGTGWPENPDVWFTINAPINNNQQNDSTDSWDAASFVENPQKMNNLQLQIVNDDASKSVFIDYVYIIAQWDWPELPGLVEYNLKPVR